MALKRIRNSIIHFTSTHQTFTHEHIAIHGLADTTEYETLTHEKATWALETVENLVAEVFLLAAVPSERIPHALHAWAGKVVV